MYVDFEDERAWMSGSAELHAPVRPSAERRSRPWNTPEFQLLAPHAPVAHPPARFVPPPPPSPPPESLRPVLLAFAGTMLIMLAIVIASLTSAYA